MKKDLYQAIKTVSSFMGHKFEPQVVDSMVEQCSLQSMKKNPLANYLWFVDSCLSAKFYFVHKRIVWEWKNYFIKDRNWRFREEYAERMSRSGLDFEFALKIDLTWIYGA